MPSISSAPLSAFIQSMWRCLDDNETAYERLHIVNSGALRSAFGVSEFAAASVGVAGLSVAKWLSAVNGCAPNVHVDSRLASLWFASSIRPQGWSLPPAWDALAGDYRTADGWIRLHTNASHHRAAALSVLGVAADKSAVADAVATWQAEALEQAIVDAKGCAAAMRSRSQWKLHSQGQAVAAEPLLHVDTFDTDHDVAWRGSPARPLQGIRVLDLTRILAGPVATRFLAGYGADVLRIDPPDWNESSIEAEVTLGKHCARLDLKRSSGIHALENLICTADVIVHGYRSDALERLDFGAARRRELNPALIDISLNAYGWNGPWRHRRGFDSLVQMSSGIAEHGMHIACRDRPTPLPVQALDHATGYLLAAAAVYGLTLRQTTGKASTMRTSLARMAELLWSALPEKPFAQSMAEETLADLAPWQELTEWGVAQRVQSPVSVSGASLRWDIAAGSLGRHPAEWRQA